MKEIATFSPSVFTLATWRLCLKNCSEHFSKNSLFQLKYSMTGNVRNLCKSCLSGALNGAQLDRVKIYKLELIGWKAVYRGCLTTI